MGFVGRGVLAGGAEGESKGAEGEVEEAAGEGMGGGENTDALDLWRRSLLVAEDLDLDLADECLEEEGEEA